MDEIAIKINHVTKIYNIYDKPIDRLKEALHLSTKNHKEHYALSDVSFEVKRGQIYGIIGTNGSGKSTILKIITGVLSPTNGNIEVTGKISALLELGAGFNPEYTGIENIYLNGMMMGYTRDEITDRLDSIIEFAGIGDFIHQPVKTYSSGMFARLAFAVSINVDPDILIIDEVLSVGDFFFQAKCYKKLEEFRERNKTILFVSHDLNSMIKYCDTVLLLNRGEQVIEASPIDAIDCYKKILAAKNERQSYQDEVMSRSTEEDIQQKNFLTINPNHEDYGTKQAEIIDFAIRDHNGIVTNSIEKNQDFEIYAKVRFNEDIEDPIIAFTVINIHGTELIGTNTMLENRRLYSVKAGSEYKFSFTQTMHLQGGNYLLRIGCTGFNGSDLVVYHRLYDICNIDVISEKHSIGFYDCDSTVTIEEVL